MVDLYIETLHVHTREGSYLNEWAKSFDERLEEIRAAKNVFDNIRVGLSDKIYRFEDTDKKLALIQKFREKSRELHENLSFGFEPCVFLPLEKRYVEILALDIKDMSYWSKRPKTVEDACELTEKSDGMLVLPHLFYIDSLGESGLQHILELGYDPLIEINFQLQRLPFVNKRVAQIAQKYRLKKVCGLDGYEEGILRAFNYHSEQSLENAIEKGTLKFYFSSISPFETVEKSFRTLVSDFKSRVLRQKGTY